MKILLTGSRAPATLELARRLASEGAEVIGVDSVRYPAGRFSRAYARHYRVPSPRFESAAFVSRIADIALAERVDFIWPTCEEIFYLAAQHPSLSQVATLLFPPLDELLPLHHKGHFVALVNSLPSPVAAPESWPAAAAPTDRRLVWKPYFSRFAALTRFTSPPLDPTDWLAQEFIEGREYSTWALAIAGEVRAQTCYTCPAKAGLGAGCAFEPAWLPEAAEFISQLAHKLRFTGSLAFDFIQRSDGKTFVLECNPRLTSGLHLLATSESLLPCLAGQSLPLPPPMQPAQLLLPTLFTIPRLAGTSRDVLWRRDDPWPALAQPLAAAEFAWIALRHGLSLAAATTHDFEFNGD